MVAMIIFARGVFQILMTAGLYPLFFFSNIHLFLSPPILISVALTIAIMVKSTRIQSRQLFRTPKFLFYLPLTTPTTLPSSDLLFNAPTTNFLTSPISDQTQPAKTRSTLPLHARTFLQRLPQYCTAILMALVGSKYLPLRPTIHIDFGWLPKLITQRVQCISLHKSICFSL